jgi:hypothetical protein
MSTRHWTLQGEVWNYLALGLSADEFTGLLRLEPTVVGLSQWNESVQKLKRGEVVG